MTPSESTPAVERPSGVTTAQVLEVTPRYFPDSGGIETHVREVSRRLAARGARVRVLTTDRSRSLPSTYADEGFTVERVPAWPRRRDYYLAPRIWRRVVDGPEQIIHCQGVHTLVPVIAMAAAVHAKKSLVVTFHTGGHSLEHRNALRRLQFLLISPLLRRANVLIGVSRHERDLFADLVDAPASQMRVIRNGGSLPRVEVGATHDLVLMSIGRLERYKGHQRLVEALPEVLLSQPDARVVILGTGPYEAELRDLADRLGVGDRVEITNVPGNDREAMAHRVAAASLVVMLSDYEAHPVAVMEALTLGRPVLALRNSGLTELADDGLVVGIDDASDAEAIAAAVLSALESPTTPGTSAQLPTWDTCADALLEVYRSLDSAVAVP
jgi:glycosyltransferase involved in cell wall biosynthesis